MIRLLLLLLLASSTFGAESSLKHEYNLVFPATAHPDQYAGKTTGHFGLKFVAAPRKRAFGIPTTPKRIRGRPEAGVVQAALLIDKDGFVKDVAIIDQTPSDLVNKDFIKYFKSVVFVPEKEGNKAIEYETELVVAFRPASEKKG